MTDYSKYRAHYLTEERARRLVKAGRCPICEMLLTSSYHTDCPFKEEIEDCPQTEIIDN